MIYIQYFSYIFKFIKIYYSQYIIYIIFMSEQLYNLQVLSNNNPHNNPIRNLKTFTSF